MEGDSLPLIHGGGPGNIGFSWQGSLPSYIVDQGFEPNFRHFDFHLQIDPPSADLVERVWRTPDGVMNPQAVVYRELNIKTTPVIVSAVLTGALVNHMILRLSQKTSAQWRWHIYGSIAGMYVYHTAFRWFARERNFYKDFERNQAYAMEEIKQRRDEQRVREALWAKQFVYDPVTEYRVKQWQTANRFA